MMTAPTMTHQRRRVCGSCLSGDHLTETDHWNTDFGRLVREFCVCPDCDGCTRYTAYLLYPQYDQRHHVHR